jgi:hypothetical protein
MSYTEIIANVDRLRNGIDPLKKWFTDEELSHIIRVSGGMFERAVTRCFLGIQQKAKSRGLSDEVIAARNNLHRFEVGFLRL